MRTISMTLETVPGNQLLVQDRNKHQYRRLLLQRSRYHITGVIGWMWSQANTTRVVSKCQKKMIRLLRHDSSRSRIQNHGTDVSFTIYVLVTSNMAKRDSSTMWIRSMLIASFSFEQFKAIREENTSILHCKTTCCCRTISPSTCTTLEAPMTYTPSSNLD